MKKLFKSTSEVGIKSLIISLFFILLAQKIWADDIIAVVREAKGNVFYTYAGKTTTLKVGSHLKRGGSIHTEEGAQISFNDYYDHRYYLSGSGHITFKESYIELKSGYFWVQGLSDAKGSTFSVATANAQADYRNDEGIISFDPYSGKTQILVLRGQFEFSNILYKENYVEVREGRFSFVKNEVNEGVPRKPTPIGYSSYLKVTGLFQNVKKLTEEQTRMAQNKPMPTPQPQTVAEKKPAQVAPTPVKEDSSFEQALGKARTPASATEVKANKTESALLNSYLKNLSKAEVKKVEPKQEVKKVKKPMAKKMAKRKVRKNAVQVNVFGKTYYRPRKVVKKKEVKVFGKGKYKAPMKKTAKVEAPTAKKTKYNRAPASIGGMVPKVGLENSSDAFEANLQYQKKNQKKHPEELNSLIDRLKSVDMDYRKEY